MSKLTTTRSDVLESEYTAGLTRVIGGVIVLIIGLSLVWLMQTMGQYALEVVAALVASGGVVLIGLGLRKIALAREAPRVTIHCPYCEFPMEFVTAPTEDFDCEGCHRRVYFANGVIAPIEPVTCQFCKTAHKVSTLARTYTCDRCNRPLKLNRPGQETIATDNTDEMLANYDVILTQVGRQPNDVAMALESILVCNLLQARQQMQNLPLLIVREVPQRKAEAIRRRLRELGATAVIRLSKGEEGAPANQPTGRGSRE